MLHSLKPEHFVIPHELQALRECPECNGQFRYGNGFMSLAHYRVTATREIQQGLACFCSATCLLRWMNLAELLWMNLAELRADHWVTRCRSNRAQIAADD
jgi:hypothetical protein